MPNVLATKLRLPAPPQGRVQRPRIIQALTGGLAAGRPLTLVSAPAGFGKTTCVSDWLHGLELPVTWLSLDADDDDPGRFFTYFIAALQKVDARLGQEIQGILRAGLLPPAEVISATLVSDILNLEGRFVLALDDFQVIQDPFILQVLAKLFTNLLQASVQQPLHLALITREDPPLPLARLRANNRLTEIRAGELRFSSNEAEILLDETFGLRLSQTDLAALQERTEGWAAGLHLAGLSIRDCEDPSGFIAALSGSHRYILGYLTEEVLSRQPEEIQQFLMDTSILDRLCGDLCDAVTGRSGGRALLERLCSANLFLAPLDDEQQWYRYHPLFADLLRDRQNALQKKRIPELHRRAGAWYAQADEAAFAGEAIRHALAAQDYPLAVRMIESHSLEMLVQWHSKTVAEWMRSLPPEWASQSPRANLAFAWMHLMGRSFQQAEPYLARLREIFSGPVAEGSPADNPAVKAEWLALQATLLGARGQAQECLRLGSLALEIVPAQDSYVRSLIYLALAGAYQQLDDSPRAMEAYRLIIQYGRAAGSLIAELLGVSALGLLTLQQGQLHYGFEIASQGIERVEHSGMLPPIAQALYGEVGQVYYQWHQLEQARQFFVRAIQISALNGYGEAEVYQGVIFSRLYQMEGDLENAAREIHKAAEKMRAAEVIAVNEEVIAQQVRVTLAHGQLGAAEAALAGQIGLAPHAAVAPPIAGQPEPAASPPVLPFSTLESDQKITYPQGLVYNSALRILLHRGLARRGPPAAQRGVASTEASQAGSDLLRGITLAGRLVDAAHRRKLVPIAIETLLLRAQLRAALGDEAAGLADVAAALELAEPEGFISIFIEEGLPIAGMLESILERGLGGQVQPAYIRRLLEAFPGQQVRAFPQEERAVEGIQPAEWGGTPAPLLENLTGRELEVLRLMAGGLKYSEIAAQLYISLNTVRSHVKVIYSKLAVNNRTQAIDLARRHRMI